MNENAAITREQVEALFAESLKGAVCFLCGGGKKLRNPHDGEIFDCPRCTKAGANLVPGVWL